MKTKKCAHSWKSYLGFSDTYAYCIKCNKKKPQLKQLSAKEKTAVEVKRRKMLTGMKYIADQRVYELSASLEGFNHVLVSAADTSDHGPETYIFGCDKNGKVLDWCELPGSIVGYLDHKRALYNAGYRIIKPVRR